MYFHSLPLAAVPPTLLPFLLSVTPIDPQVLGRADHLHSFVSHGVDEDASVAVELYDPEGPNIIITRTFNRASNRSFYTVNGRSAEK